MLLRFLAGPGVWLLGLALFGASMFSGAAAPVAAQAPSPAASAFAEASADRLAAQGTQARSTAIPRTADGTPNLQGIWQVRNRSAYGLEDHVARHGMPAGRSVVDGGTIPYQEWALKQRNENVLNRRTLDPLEKCFLPGVPRIMYLEFPFHIFQTPTHIGITFEWSQVFRLIYTNGSKHVQGIDFWQGDSRGRWDGDTLVVEVANFNDRTWFDAAGNFHSAEMTLEERFTLLDADTIRYEVTVTDPRVFTRPWRISMPLYRHKDMDRILEYQCQAEAEEASGAFPRDPLTWYPKP